MQRRNRSKSVLTCLLALCVGAAAAHADEPAVRPFEDRLIRPVPGYTVACRHEITVAERRRYIAADVTVVERDEDGSRLRYLTQGKNGSSVEVAMRFDRHGSVRGAPTVVRDGRAARRDTVANFARAVVKSAEAALYLGRPVSSGDTFVTPLTTDEAEAMVEFYARTPVHVVEWLEVGHIEGVYRHRRYGEVVIVERGIHAIVEAGRETLLMSIRAYEHYDLSSGLIVANNARATLKYSDSPRVIRTRHESDCKYVSTP
jgi:hypothetical protein